MKFNHDDPAQSRFALQGKHRALACDKCHFVVDVPTGSATLVVRAPGFAEKQQPAADGASVTIVLEPAGLREDVTVVTSRTEQRLGDVPASVNGRFVSPCEDGRSPSVPGREDRPPRFAEPRAHH